MLSLLQISLLVVVGPNLVCGQFAQPLNLPNVSKRMCRNEHDDLGVCLNELECESSGGLNIGVCKQPRGTKTAATKDVCCFSLPCNVPTLSNSEQEFIFNNGLRVSRDLRHIVGGDSGTGEPASPVLPVLTENCGMRDLAKDSQDFPFNKNNLLNRAEQLIRGRPAKSSEKFPWMLALWIRFKKLDVPTCGAGLISSKYAITAAHCVQDDRVTYLLRGGSIINKIARTSSNGSMFHPNDENEGVIMEIESILSHPKYQPFTYENDIALIRLKQKIRPTRDLFPICLPPAVLPHEKITDYSGENVTVSGWGCEREDCGLNEVPTVLREAVIPVVPNEIGMCWFMNDTTKGGRKEYVPSRLFIVGGDESMSVATCNGDSGSPVVRQRPGSTRRPGSQPDRASVWEIVGLVSWSKGCGRPLRPCVWTRVESFVDWIISNMKD